MQGASERVPRDPARFRWARSPLHAVCDALGPVVGLVAAVSVHNRGWTFPGAVMAFLVGSATVGWALPDVIIGPRRFTRLAFVVVPVVTGLAGSR